MAGRNLPRRGRGRRPQGEHLRVESSVGTVELVPDRARPGGRLLLIDGLSHGYVDLDDPTHLQLDYVARIGAALEALLPRGQATRVLHIGGGAFSLPRYIASTRPQATQTVIERSAAVVKLAEGQLRLRRGPALQVITGDAAAETGAFAESSFDLVIGDAFVGTETPEQLAGERFAAEVARLLAPSGRYLLNLVDGPPWPVAADEARTLAGRFAHVLAFGGREVMRGRHSGNVLLLASPAPLPEAALERALAGGAHPAELAPAERLAGWTGRPPRR